MVNVQFVDMRGEFGTAPTQGECWDNTKRCEVFVLRNAVQKAVQSSSMSHSWRRSVQVTGVPECICMDNCVGKHDTEWKQTGEGNR